jgi:hypothetical protein
MINDQIISIPLKNYVLKIIDFAESYSENTKHLSQDYACSHPYSPLECSQKKNQEEGKISGIVNQ